MAQDPANKVETGGGPGWMFIFADVLALLLTFFVLLFSMNTLQADGWQAVVSTFTARLNPSRPHSVPDPEVAARAAQISQPGALDLNYLGSLIEVKIKDNPLLAKAVVRRLADRLVVSVPTDLLFEPGAAGLARSGAAAAASLGELFANVTNRIAVAGHAEPRPHGESSFTNQWELSLARAIVIARSIRAGGYSRPISAYGQGEAGAADAGARAPNAIRVPRRGAFPDPGQSFARRIDIMVLKARSEGGAE